MDTVKPLPEICLNKERKVKRCRRHKGVWKSSNSERIQEGKNEGRVQNKG